MGINSGDCAFVLLCAALVFLMTPGLAFFYGGMVRRKNVLNTMFSSFVICGLASVVWIVCGYSLAFTGNMAGIIGGFKNLFFQGVSMDPNPLYSTTIPETLFAAFQMMFAIITIAIITGSIVGRMKFSVLLVFITAWLLLVYSPLAHMVWGDGGFLRKLGTLDFAGGDVVHISSGVSGLVACLVLGSRKGYGMVSYKPHNIPFVLLGAGLLWFGWFGFNAGSALGANSLAAHAFITTNTSAAMALLSWVFIEKIIHGKPTLLGAATGGILGLVAITPGAGFVPIWSSLIIGALVSPLCYFFMTFVKNKFKYDDSLDAFGCHGIGGIWGGIATGIFASPAVNSLVVDKGLFFGGTKLILVQLTSIGITIAFAAIVTFVILKVIQLFTNIRVSPSEEANGLDISEHNESAYPSFMGLD